MENENPLSIWPSNACVDLFISFYFIDSLMEKVMSLLSV